MHKFKTLLAVAASGMIAAIPATLLAQDAAAAPEEIETFEHPVHFVTIPDFTILVTATGHASNFGNGGQAITVITASEIASIQGADFTRIIERAPGVTFSRNGGLGGFTGIRVRGAEAEQLLVLIDGVRVNDPASPSGGYDFGGLVSGNIGKLELLRGSNSVIWGSQAMGGVLAISSPADARNSAAISAEGGARDTLNFNANAHIVGSAAKLSAAAGWVESDGISSFANGREADGMRQVYGSGRAEIDLAGGFAADLRGRYAHTRADIDGFPAPDYQFADTDEFQKTREWSGYGGLVWQRDQQRITAGYSISDTSRDSFNPAFGSEPGFRSQGRNGRAELRGHGLFDVLDQQITIDAGIESERSRFETSPFGSKGKTGMDSGYGLLGLHGNRFSIALGARHDDHRNFGSQTTLSASGSLEIASDLRLRASYGEGFKAPTLFQLLSDYGNQSLTPETAKSFDIGIDLSSRNWRRPVTGSLTLFRRDTRQQIDYVSCFGVTTGICANRPFGTYDNIGKARANGMEAELGLHPADGVQLRAAYSYVKATNRSTGAANFGNDLARRTRHALTLSSDWEVDPDQVFATTLGADLRMVSDSFDNAANSVPIDGHAVVTLRFSRPILMLDSSSQRTVTLFGRIENLFDHQYQTAAGYGTAGRGAYVGVRAAF